MRTLQYLLHAANALQHRFALLGSTSDCETAIEIIRSGLSGKAGTEAPAELRAALLGGLALVLQERYLAAGDADDLHAAAAASRMSASLLSPDDPFRAKVLSGLGHVLSLLYRLTAGEAHQAEAVWAYTEIIESVAADQGLREHASAACTRLQLREDDAPVAESALRREALAEEANSAHRGYGADHSLNELNRAITFTRLLLQEGSPSEGSHVSDLIQLGEYLLERYGMTSWPADADEALTVAVQASQSATDSRSLAAALCTEASAWLARHRATADQDAVDNAIAAATRSVQESPADDPERAWSHNSLGTSLMRRYEEADDIRDGRRGADQFRQALALVGPENPHRGLILNNLGAVLRSIFDHTREPDILIESIDTLTMAANAEGKPSAAVLGNLGNAYMNRFYMTADPADVGRARKAYEQALEGLPPSDSQYHVILYGFFKAVTSEPDPNPEELRLAARSVAALIENHPPADGIWHHRLGSLLNRIFHDSGDAGDLDRAVDACRKAVELTPPEHSMRFHVLGGLAHVLRDRYDQIHDPRNLDEAEALARQCIAELPARTFLAVALRTVLEQILKSRLQAQPDPARRNEILRLASEISASAAAPPLVRAIEAQHAAAIFAEAGDWRHAAEHYELAVNLLPLIAPDRDLREGIRVLRPGGAAAYGAACWLNAGEPERAAVLMEHGRAVFISRASARRTDLAALRAKQPDLAGKFETLRARLDSPDPARAVMAGLWEEAGPITDQAAAAAQFEELLSVIRSLPGQERFLLPPRIEDLIAASAEGPVVLLNASSYRCDALILTPMGVRAVPLREVSLRALVGNAVHIQMACANAHQPGLTAENREYLRSHAVNTLTWMWDHVVAPVLKEIETENRRTNGPWPRIWWSPGGPFAWLPLHAAGRHGELDNEDAPTLLDRAQSSYIPSVSMLADARARSRQAAEPGKVLVVAMPKTPGQRDLPAAITEARAIADRYPATILGTMPGAAPATRGAVREALPAHPHAHFACHATGDWNDPWRSFFAIQPGQPGPANKAGALSLSDIASLDLRGPRFACLSACAAARPTQLELMDEALHLSSGFLVAGFTHVSGTLWEIDDEAAAEFAREIYARLEADPSVIDPGRAALAVHEATRILRRKYTSDPVLWASHIYAGP